MKGGATVVAVALLLTSINLPVYAEPDEEVKAETIEQVSSESVEQVAKDITEQSDNSTINMEDNQQNFKEIQSVDEPENEIDADITDNQIIEETETGDEDLEEIDESEEEIDEQEELESEEKELMPVVKSSNKGMLLGASPNGTAEYIPLKCLLLNYDSNMNMLKTAYQNLDIPYQITSQSTKYKWECTFSHLKKTYTDRCGSIVGIYDKSNNVRSGYLYSTKNSNNFQVCVGANRYDTAYNLDSDNKNTITAEYDGSAHTYSIKDTLDIIGSASGSWSGSYALNKTFNLTSCATYDSYADSRAEFVAMKFYEVKIWEWQNGAYTLKVDMIPVKMKSGDTWVPGVYDVVSGKFQDKPSFGTSNFAFEENTTKITFDNQGATSAGTTELMVSPGTTLMTITTPTKTGCTFDGYYTGTNGSGTKYYDSTGRSLRTWDSASNGTLYANWIHNHTFKYSVDGSKIYAYCDNAANNDQCTYYAANATTAKTKSGIHTVEININGGAYTGSAYIASTKQTNNFTSVTGASIGSISYKKKNGTALSGAPKDAGDYTASVTVASNTISKDFTISKINQSGVTVSMNGYTYGQTLPTPSINNAKENPSVMYYYSTTSQTSGGTEWSGMTSQTLPYGTYYMYAVLNPTTNYNEFTTPAVSFTVSKATRNVSASVSGWTYGQSGDVPSPTVNATLPLPGEPTITYYYNTANSSAGGTLWSEISNTSTLDTGTYYVYATVSETENYNAFTTDPASFAIGKAACTVTAPTGKTDLKYTGSAQELLATSGSVSGGTMYYSTAKDGAYLTTMPAETNAGTYSVWYKGVGDSNHEDSTPAEIKVTIAKVPCEVTAPTPKELVYTGVAQVLANAGSPSTGAAKIQYCSTQNGTYTDTIPSETNAGEYSVWYKGVGDSNHEDSTPAEIKVMITKADCTYTAPGAKSLKFSGSAQELVDAGTTGDGTFYYSFKKNEDYSIAIPTATARDEYTVWYKIAGDSNHNDVAPQSIQVTIDKNVRATITVSMSNYTYEQEEPIPTPATNPTKDELYETPEITFFYNTADSNEGGTEWKGMDSVSLNAGTYYMYALVEETDSYLEYKTATAMFTVNKSTGYTVTPPTGKITYGQKLSEAALEGGSASKQGNFDWKDSVKGEKPQVSDSELTEYDMVFTPSGDDAVNYAPVTVKAKVIVVPKKVNPEINDIKLVDQDGTITVTETIKELDLGVTLTGGTDYEKEAVKEPEKTGDTSTNYTITYTFKGNFAGTATKKVSVPKAQKQGDNIISTAQSDTKAEEKYKPEIKPVSYDDAKKVINEEIGKVAEDSSSEQQDKAQAIVEKLEAGKENEIAYDAELSVEMTALENAPAQDEIEIKKKAEEIPKVSDDIRYVDISVYLTYTAQIGEDENTKITQSKEQIHDLSDVDVKETITMEVPADMRIVPSGYERTYYVIRAHKNTDETIETSIIAQTKSTTITITSDKFSTYALAYSDSLKPEEPEEPSGSSSNDNSTAVIPPVAAKPAAVGYASPKTGDTKELYVLIGLLIIGAAVFVSGSRKKTR